MRTTTELTWMLLIFVLLIGFVNRAPLGDSPLVWGSAMFLQVPFEILMAIATAVPLLAPLTVLALLYYFIKVLDNAFGEGYVMFIVAAVLILVTGV